MLASYFFYQSYGNTLPKSALASVIEYKLRELAGNYDKVYNKNIEIILFDLHHMKDASIKDDFINEISSLAKQETWSTLDINDIVYQLGLKIDTKILCTLLLRNSNSVNLIKGSVILDYFLPLLKNNTTFPRTLTINKSGLKDFNESNEVDNEQYQNMEIDANNGGQLIKKLTEGSFKKK